MKKIIFALVLLASLSSCLTVNQIKKNCDKFSAICVTNVETVVEYRDTTIYINDTITVVLPVHDTTKIIEHVILKNGRADMKPITKEFGLIGVKAWVNNSVLNAWGFLLDSTILQPVHDTIILDNIFKKLNLGNIAVDASN